MGAQSLKVTIRAAMTGQVENQKEVKMAIPYAAASSDMRAREEIKKILTRFGCESIGFMDDMKEHKVLLAFTHRGRQVQLRASAKGWAQIYT